MQRRFVRSIGIAVLFFCFVGTVGSAFAATASKGTHQAPNLAVAGRGIAGVIADGTNDNIPGQLIDLEALGGYTTINDSLDVDTDADDVFSVYLAAGETVTLNLDGDAGTDFDLYVFGPAATDIWADDSVADAFSTSYPDAVTFTAEVTGEYYIDACTWYEDDVSNGGSGNYSLYMEVLKQDTQVQISTQTRTLKFGSSATVAGSVFGHFWGPTGLVNYYRSFDGRNFSPIGGATIDGGPFSFGTGAVDRKTWFRVSFLDNVENMGNAADVVFTSTASVGNAVAPAAMYRTKYYSVYGYLKPRHVAGTYPVRIYKYRYVSGAWKSYGYTNAKAANYSSYTKYAASVRLPYAGKWRVRAYAPADSGHVATWGSAYDYVTVK